MVAGVTHTLGSFARCAAKAVLPAADILARIGVRSYCVLAAERA